MARHAWLLVTHMSLSERWFAGQWDMLAVEDRKVWSDYYEEKMKKQIEANKAKMGITSEVDKEEVAEKVEEAITAAGLWKTLNF